MKKAVSFKMTYNHFAISGHALSFYALVQPIMYEADILKAVARETWKRVKQREIQTMDEPEKYRRMKVTEPEALILRKSLLAYWEANEIRLSPYEIHLLSELVQQVDKSLV